MNFENEAKESILQCSPEVMLDKAEPFLNLMMRYKCAIMEVETKLNVLNSEFSLNHNRNPIESIKTRLKKPASIIEKMNRRGFELNVESIEENLFDIAGIRVICSFVDDIYTVANLLINQDDIKLIRMKDYIKNPKENGYRSLHLIIEVPIFLSNEKKYMKAEVQLRTIAMDFWASLDHKLRYKQDLENPEDIAGRLKECAVLCTDLDKRMQDIRNEIDNK